MEVCSGCIAINAIPNARVVKTVVSLNKISKAIRNLKEFELRGETKFRGYNIGSNWRVSHIFTNNFTSN